MEEPSSSKRCHVVTGSTPHKPVEKRSREGRSRVRKPLDFSGANLNTSVGSATSPSYKVLCRSIRKSPLKSPIKKSPVKQHKWTFEEERALVEFVGMGRMDPKYGGDSSNEWPAFRATHMFWTDAAHHIKTITCSNILLTNSRIRTRAYNVLRGKFPSLDAAEAHYKLTLTDCLEELDLSGHRGSRIRRTPTGVDKVTQTPALEISATPPFTPAAQTTAATSVVELKNAISVLDDASLSEIANMSFLKLAIKNGIDTNPADFASKSIRAMKRLQEHGKNNLLYKFAFCIANSRPGSDVPLFPLDRMPFGLVEYQIEFFAATNIAQLKVPEDFRIWHETMCTEFPTRFNRLFRGPMWSNIADQFQRDPLYARPNVAAPSTRTVQRNTAASDFSHKPELQLQIEALKQLKLANPDGRFWIKVDAFDVKAILQESVKGVWNGDVDLGDGKLALFNEEYERRKSLCKSKDLKDDSVYLESRLNELKDFLQRDVTFLSSGLIAAEQEYEKKFNAPNTSQHLLKTLCWERVEFNTLLQQAQCFIEKYEAMISSLHQEVPRQRQVITALQNIEEDAITYLRNLFIKKRQPGATHVLLFLISDERRNKKPYALPVQYVPYKSIRDQFVRDLTDDIKREMVKMDLKPVGGVSDGEFNSLRTQGATRPLHIWQLIHDAKESVSRQSERTLTAMLLKTGEQLDGSPVVQRPDHAIPYEVIEELHQLQTRDGLTFHDALTRLRGALVPQGYAPHSFRPKVTESRLDKLRSLVATYRYRHRITELAAEGVDLKTYLYVPEMDPVMATITMNVKTIATS
ncbi:uncharacterized protein LOC144642774 isoform X1 [Oculina patagonica]